MTSSPAASNRLQVAAPPPEIVYSCEICGQDDLNEAEMRTHMEAVHLKGALQCPFCDLSSHDVTANEMTLHVNSAHLEYLTPEREDVAFLEDYESMSDFDSIWQLEKGAKEGLTNGVDQSPTQPKNLNCIHSKQKVASAGGNANGPQQMDSPMSTSTEVSEVASEVSGSSPAHSTTSSSAGGGCTSLSASAAASVTASGLGNNGGAIQKRFKSFNSTNSSQSANASPSKTGLSLNIKPSWAPLASLNGSTASLDRTTTTSTSSSSHLSGAKGKLVERQSSLAEERSPPPSTSSKICQNASELLSCPLCDHKCGEPSKLEEHVNRVHFDPESPASSSAASAASENGLTTNSQSLANPNHRGQKRDRDRKNLNNDVTPSSLPCPLCTAYYATSLELERHVNRDHSDVLSPMTTKRRPSLRDLVPPASNTATSPTPSTTSSLASLRQNQTSTAPVSGTTSNNVVSPSDGNGNQECPVCNVTGFQNQNQLAEHIDSHFNEKKSNTQQQPPQQQPQPLSSQHQASKLYGIRSGLGGCDGHSISSMSSSSSSSSSSATTGHNQKLNNDYLLAQELERRERERRRCEEQREFDQLRAQFGMDNDGNFHTQSISNMQNAVYKGEMSVVDYYERQSELRSAEKSGMDDGRSQTKHLMPRLKAICQTAAQGVAQTYLCSVVDHHSSSFGDKGWGCGYRNLQMLLSSLTHHTPYSERLGMTSGKGSGGVASISRLQSLIEEAWRKGFDVQGSEQLGGKLVNTRKWIGATEIVAFFTAHRIKTELLDFHTPTAKDGTHPKLFQWVLDYFRERARAKAFTPPLYLQHQGHSRTIVGIEVLTSSSQGHGAHGSSAEGRNLRLLVFDPSHSKAHMATLSKSSPTSAEAGQVMRMLRKAPASIKCKQYQIVTVGGVFATDKEATMHKVISSKRVP